MRRTMIVCYRLQSREASDEHNLADSVRQRLPRGTEVIGKTVKCDAKSTAGGRGLLLCGSGAGRVDAQSWKGPQSAA